MKFHGIELTGSFGVKGAGLRVSGSAESTASFGTLTVAGFSGANDIVQFSSSLAQRVAQSAEAGTISGVTAGTGLTGGGSSGTVTVNVDFEDSSFKAAISGSTTALSESIATDITSNSSSLAARIKTVEDLDRDDDLNFAGDSGGTLTIDMDSETLTIAGGDNITTAGSGNTLTITNDFDAAGISGSLGPNAALIRSLNATGVSGSFFSVSESIAADIAAVTAGGGEFNAGDSASLADRLDAAELELNETLVSASAQLAAAVSGSTGALSASLSTDITANSSSLAARIKTVEDLDRDDDLNFAGDSGGTLTIDMDSETLTIAGGDNITTAGSGNTLTITNDFTLAGISGSLGPNAALIRSLNATGISGSFFSVSESIAADIASVTAGGGEFNAGDSGSISSRLSGISGSTGELSASIATDITNNSSSLAARIKTVEDLDRDDDLNFQGDSGGALTIDMDSETLTIAGGDNITTAGSGNTLTITNDFTKAGISGSLSAAGVAGLSAGIMSGSAQLTEAGALMDSEVTNLAFVKGLASGISNGNVLVANAAVSDNDFLKIDGTSVEGRTAAEVRSDLNVEDGADVTDATNVTAAGALMDSEVTSLELVKGLTGAGISGSFFSVSESIAADIASVTAGGGEFNAGDSGSISQRLFNAESELAETLISQSAQIATAVSGAFEASSASIDSRIDGINARLTTEESNVDTLQGRDIIAGTGLTGGGTLAADRTLNVVGGTGIVANADDIAVDFSDSTFASGISGSFGAVSGAIEQRLTSVEGGSTSKTLVSSSAQLADAISGSTGELSASIATDITNNSSSLAARIKTVEDLDRDDDLNFAGDSGGTLTIDMDSETLTIAGGANITTAGSGNTLTITNDFDAAGISGSAIILSSSVEQRLSANGVESSVVHNQTVASARWAVTHSLNNQYPTITVWGENDTVIVPATIKGDNANQLTITFSQAITGKAVMR